MSILEEMLKANDNFIKKLPNDYVDYCPWSSKIPKRELAIFTCMDTRLVDFLEPALGIRRGEAKVIKNAGNSVTGPFEATIRSLVVSIFELGVKEIFVIGHMDCGIAHASSKELVRKMLDRGISPDALKMVEKELEDWLDHFHHPIDNVEEVVQKICKNPLIPNDVPVHGLIFNPQTGEVKIVVNGYKI
ncbi:beta-class carbonic anhydrase [Pelosinus propionicus]|uniref:carbonic anhydrase n=1 Tax=Pelosinus propionicus DSM 13327 TaxID=1123291 RepID=A0A1I4P026_9FIRM|nr:carbonic anhydrase [Pelosinus propionicus]SFM21141.1 carbonic anhydrase [Pelosinus propionicus DSM 13327]